MTKKIRYVATWPDVDWTRSSHRTYTHAWRVDYRFSEADKPRFIGGFSGSEQLAEAAKTTQVNSFLKWDYEVLSAAVVAVKVL